MLLSVVSVLVVAQSSSEVPEGLMNNPVYSFFIPVCNCFLSFIKYESSQTKQDKLNGNACLWYSREVSFLFEPRHLLRSMRLISVCILLLSHSLTFFRFLFYKIWLYFMYFYWKRLCILIDVYVFLMLVYVFLSCLCVVYVFLDASTLTEVFPCFFLSCKANARVKLAKTGHGPHSPKLLCCSMYCLFCVVLFIVCV